VVDITVVWLIVSWLVAIFGGITASLLGYLKDTTQGFSKRLFAYSIITGAISGFAFAFGSGTLNPVFKDSSSPLVEVVYQMGLIYIGAIGVDFLRKGTESALKVHDERKKANKS
jgi:hypothetical protein